MILECGENERGVGMLYTGNYFHRIAIFTPNGEINEDYAKDILFPVFKEIVSDILNDRESSYELNKDFKKIMNDIEPIKEFANLEGYLRLYWQIKNIKSGRFEKDFGMSWRLLEAIRSMARELNLFQDY